jgi:hypothetical protein
VAVRITAVPRGRFRDAPANFGENGGDGRRSDSPVESAASDIIIGMNGTTAHPYPGPSSSLAFAAVLLVGACGGTPTGSNATKVPAVTTAQTARAAGGRSATSVSSSTSIPEAVLQDMHAALQAWATFPVNASPRPLVLTTDPVSAPARGFRTVDAKEAFLSGAFTAPAVLPSGPRHAAGYPVTTAADAFALLRAEGTPAGGAPRPPTPLVITGVRFGESSFGTDRGTRLLPAWLFSFEGGVQDPGAVVAIAESSRFTAPAESLHRSSVGARLDPDGRTATIMFTGAAPGHGPCTADYIVDQLASHTAVAVRVRETPRSDGASSEAVCPSVGYARGQDIVLGSALGDRVLVDATTNGPVAIAP